MGDFSSIQVVGKSAARMGQCFSSTVDAATVLVRCGLVQPCSLLLLLLPCVGFLVLLSLWLAF
jgi:hypothetical protein